MGYYINNDSKGNVLPALNKASALIESGDAKLALPTNSFSDIPSGKALVCVARNMVLEFDAVAFAFNEREFQYFSEDDGREKIWLEMDRELAERLSDYNRTAREHSELVSKRMAVSVPTPVAHVKYDRYNRPFAKKKTKKNSFQANYCKGYAIVNGEVKQAKSKTVK